MEDYGISLLALMTGFGIGWIACHALVVSGLIRQIIEMRALGFSPTPRETHEEQEDFPSRNET